MALRFLTPDFFFADLCKSAFWREDKLRRIAPVMVEQLPACIQLATAEGKTALPQCLDAITEAVSDDALLKSINLDLLMHTRSEDVRLRTFALACSEVLWQSHGGKLQGKLRVLLLKHPHSLLYRLCCRNNYIPCRVCGR